MNYSFFITGTDTEIGKTYTTCQLLDYFCQQEISCIGMKPIASGAFLSHDQLQNNDAQLLIKHASTKQQYQHINPYCFAPAIAPHIAAAQANTTIEISKIEAQFQYLKEQCEVLLVEGVGGWLTPINEQQDIADLVKELDIPVILVIGIRLGCINHSMLSVANIKQRGCQLIGWVANELSTDMPYSKQNIEYLQQHIDAPMLAHLAYQKSTEEQAELRYIDISPLNILL